MPDPDAVRKEWARRVDAAYDGWPQWRTPDAEPGQLPRPPRVEGATGTDRVADPPTTTSPGWTWGLPEDELEDLDRRLWLRQRTGRTARALRAERAYWGLDPEDD